MEYVYIIMYLLALITLVLAIKITPTPAKCSVIFNKTHLA